MGLFKPNIDKLKQKGNVKKLLKALYHNRYRRHDYGISSRDIYSIALSNGVFGLLSLGLRCLTSDYLLAIYPSVAFYFIEIEKVASKQAGLPYEELFPPSTKFINVGSIEDKPYYSNTRYQFIEGHSRSSIVNILSQNIKDNVIPFWNEYRVLNKYKELIRQQKWQPEDEMARLSIINELI